LIAGHLRHTCRTMSGPDARRLAEEVAEEATVLPQSKIVDRAAVREMVEDFWRSYVPFIRDLQAKYPRTSPCDLQNECMEFSQRALASI
jgi:hypothetical protein